MEEAETIEVEASHGGSAIGTGTITIGKEVSRDPPTVSITPAAVQVSEGESAVFTLTRANDDTENPQPLTVSVSQTRSVLAGPTPDQVTFGANEDVTTLSLTTDDDDVVENDGQVTVTITAPEGYLVLGEPSATVTIADNDTAEFGLSVDPASVAEGESSTVKVSITNSVTFAEDQTIALSFSGSATAG